MLNTSIQGQTGLTQSQANLKGIHLSDLKTMLHKTTPSTKPTTFPWLSLQRTEIWYHQWEKTYVWLILYFIYNIYFSRIISDWWCYSLWCGCRCQRLFGKCMASSQLSLLQNTSHSQYRLVDLSLLPRRLFGKHPRLHLVIEVPWLTSVMHYFCLSSGQRLSANA